MHLPGWALFLIGWLLVDIVFTVGWSRFFREQRKMDERDFLYELQHRRRPDER